MQLPAEQVTTKEVLQWQGLHLLHYHMSSCSQKVRILLGELGIKFTSHHIDLRRGEQKTPWYLGINPNGVVPVLVHDGAVHIESNDIIQYLNERFAPPEASLIPGAPEPAAQMQVLMDLEDQLHQDLRTVTFTYLAPSGSMHNDATAGQGLDYIGRFHGAFSQLTGYLQQQPFLLGTHLTLADIAWFISVHRLKIAGYPLRQHPELHAYYLRLAERPAFKKQVAAGPILLRCAGAVYRNLNRLTHRSLARDFERWEQISSCV